MKKTLLVAAIAAVLSGCGVNAVKIHEPTSARPQAPQVQNPNADTGGSLFLAGNFRPLFEDRRARFVGDTMTIVIAEKASASNATTGGASRSASTSVQAPKVFGVPGKMTQDTNVQMSASTKIDEKDGTKLDNVFTGTITVTVVEVLANGNLLVSGEKQIGINGDVDTLRFSGVVNPVTIGPGNTVSSVQVADARIDTMSRSNVDPARVAGFLGRFFMSFMPFR